MALVLGIVDHSRRSSLAVASKPIATGEGIGLMRLARCGTGSSTAVTRTISTLRPVVVSRGVADMTSALLRILIVMGKCWCPLSDSLLVSTSIVSSAGSDRFEVGGRQVGGVGDGRGGRYRVGPVAGGPVILRGLDGIAAETPGGTRT